MTQTQTTSPRAPRPMPVLSVSDAETETLLARIALGDRESHARLCRIAAPRIMAIALGLLDNRPEAEAALVDTCIRLWREAALQPATGLAPATWILAIARAESLTRRRARAAAAPVPDDAALLADLAPPPAPSASRLAACLDRIDPVRADAFRDVCLQGADYPDLARRHGLPPATIRPWFHKTLRQIAACLAP